MNQELMTLDFWQDTVIYEGKTFPVGTLACDALNVPVDTVAKMNEQCEKRNMPPTFFLSSGLPIGIR